MSIALTTAANAQQAPAWRDSAMRLAEQVRALRDSILTGDSTIQEVTREGDLVIGASAGLRREALNALARLKAVRARWFGAVLPSPAGFRILLNGFGEQSWAFGSRPRRTGEMLLVGLPDTGGATRTVRVLREDQFETGLTDVFGELMWQSAGRYLMLWLSLPPPLSMRESERRYIAMYALVTGTGRAQRGCVGGNLADCAYTLGLAPPTSEDPGGTFAPFLRTDLLLTALELGGSRAWERFRPLVGPRPGPALEAAANMPLDSLLSRWRNELLAVRPDTNPVHAATIVLTLCWTAAAGLAALGAARWL